MLSIIFATYNGQSTLPTMLEAFLDLSIPEAGIEIIAVDNASTDASKDILLSYEGKLPITYLYEEKAGKNNALNKAIEIAKGELFVFTDDDIIPDKRWLIEMDERVKSNPEYDVFAGRILPKWPRKPEPFNTLSGVIMGICYAITHDNLLDGGISATLVWGPNMAIRANVFRGGVRFNSNIGPDGTSNYSMGSETELTRRLESEGHKSYFINSAFVYHMIRENQMSWDWIKQRAGRFGRGDITYKIHSNTISPKLLEHTVQGIPRYMYRELISLNIKKYLSLLGLSKRDYYMYSWEIHYLLGQMAALKQFDEIS